MKRVTRQRVEIERVLAQAGRPLTPSEILEAGRQHIPALSIATVYRNLRDLQKEKRVAVVPMPGDRPLYESVAALAQHHHHFQCTRCRRVFDIGGCPDGLESMLPAGFRLEHHEMTLYGHCAECAARPAGCG